MSETAVRIAGAPDPSPDDRLARDLRGFGPVGLLALLVLFAANLVFIPIGTVLILLWAKRAGIPWFEIGYVRTRRWVATLLLGTVLGIAFKLILKSIVMPLLGAPPINATYHFLVGNTAAAIPFVFQLIVHAGIGEETFFRGYLFERFRRLLGRSTVAKIVTVLVTSAFFASLHGLDQGLPGVQQAAITGLVFGTIYAVTGSLWLPMVMHAAFDLTALAIIYWDLERTVASWFFR